MNLTCRICGNDAANTVHRAREMMFGTRDEFEYLECSACGTVQIVEIPDLSPYYPANYLSFDAETPLGKTFLHRMAARFVGRYLMHGKGLIGETILKLKPGIAFHYAAPLRDHPLDIGFDSKILDFGCGSGQLLRSLHYLGFNDLLGVDAFISEDIEHPEGVRILKRSLAELEPAFDLIMLHHSFEHLADPRESLVEIKRLLAPGGTCLIRLPIVNFAWEKYGVNWVQMDPPRHLFLYSQHAMRQLAEDAGFEVEAVIYDSTGFQFWGSEQYVQDIPLFADGEGGGIKPSSIFTQAQLAKWDDEAQRLNAESRGDSACFYLRLPS